jgi:hypothetical protein
MLQAASQTRELAESVRLLAEDPQRLERGLVVLDVGLKLTPDATIDLVCKDAAARWVVVLGEGTDGPAALLGRALCVLAEARRMRELLARLFQQEGVSFDAGPRALLVARRFSDALHGDREALASLGIELIEWPASPHDRVRHREVVRAGAAPRNGAAPAADPAPPDVEVDPGVLVGASEVEVETAPLGSSPPARDATPPLVDELKKKILRISDDLEEEVDGATVRFRLHDELIASVEPHPDGCSMAVGDAPDRPRVLADRRDLNRAVDDVVRRYFLLVRRFSGRAKSRSSGEVRAR